MNRQLVSFATAAALVASTAAVFAQWPSYPTGVPKTPDGKPDLTAPAPRMADGKPDFSGTWTLAPGRGGAGRGGAKGKGAPPPQPAPDDPPIAQFFNIGAGFKDGLLPFQPWAAELRAQRKADNNKDNPDAHCLPLGLTQLHMHPQPRKIIQTSKVMVILYEANANLRQIFLDGRPLPGKDADAWWYGYSTGHWDGDTLVVETNGFRDDVWLDVEGSPLTNAGKMTERFRRLNMGTMQIDITVDDPKAYTKPWTVRVNHRLMPDEDLIEFVCEERDAIHYVGQDGKK